VQRWAYSGVVDLRRDLDGKQTVIDFNDGAMNPDRASDAVRHGAVPLAPYSFASKNRFLYAYAPWKREVMS